MSVADNSTTLLEGQTQALTNDAGLANFTALILSAPPGNYQLSVSLPDYVQVADAAFHMAIACRSVSPVSATAPAHTQSAIQEHC